MSRRPISPVVPGERCHCGVRVTPAGLCGSVGVQYAKGILRLRMPDEKKHRLDLAVIPRGCREVVVVGPDGKVLMSWGRDPG